MMKSRLMSLGFDIWKLLCNGYTKNPPSSQELQTNELLEGKYFLDTKESQEPSREGIIIGGSGK